VNILIVKPSSLGDIVHTFPAVALVRERFPAACIGWVVNRPFAPVVEACGLVDRVLVFPRHALHSPSPGRTLRGFVRELRAFRADVCVDFQGLLRSGVVAFASRARRRIGFRGAREGAWLFYTERIEPPSDVRHALDRNRALVRAAFGLDGPARFPAFILPKEVRARARDIRLRRRFVRDVEDAGPVLAVAPAARWRTKVWPAASFSEVIDQVAGAVPGLDVWILGSDCERDLCAAVAAGCRRAAPLDLAGKTDLTLLAALLREADALLCNDTGALHLAVALGRPTIAVFGPTDPVRTGPYGAGHVVLGGGCPKAPCFRKECALAPAGCWRALTPQAVSDAVVRTLGRVMQEG